MSAGLLAAQRARWERGERPLVEVLRAEAPQLSAEDLLDLVYHEILLREEQGEAPGFVEYERRFPELAADLRLHFEVHGALEAAALEVPEGDCVGREVAPVIPGYEMGERLGRGGMGVVYAARQISLDRRVAIKLLPGDGSHEDREALRRFHEEAYAASALNHPHICTILDFGTVDGQPFIVLELVVGRTLAAARNLSTEAVVGVCRQVAEALAAAHAAGVVHRDIKPANIMVRDDGYAKVLDFGLARLLPGTARQSTLASGVIVGTPRYMSPEQARGEAVGPASDVYSLGLVLRELGGEAASAGEVGGLLQRMLAEEPAARPSMGEVAAALAGLGAGRRAAARGKRRGPWLLLAVVLAVLVAASALPLRKRSLGPAAGAPPSVVVLPFAAADPESSHLSTGVTEDITAMLARAPDLAVLSTSAALQYKDQPTEPQRIGRALGVAYLLEGSVRRESGRLRLIARLVDAQSGADVWSERFDRSGADPWALQDEIAGRIVGALTGEYGQLKRGQYRAAWGSDTTTLGEYDHYLRGHEFYMRLTEADNERAGAAWRRGLEAYPDSTLLQVKLGFYHFMRPYLFFRAGAAADYARAGALARTVLAAPHLSPLERRLGHWLFAYVSAAEGEFDRARREVAATMEMAPYDAFQRGDLASMLILACDATEALRMLDGALAQDPASRPFYQQLRGWALCVAERHAESEAALRESIDLPAVPLLQAINRVRLGRIDDARRAVARALQQDATLTTEKWAAANFYRDPAVLLGQVAVLRAAGLPGR